MDADPTTGMLIGETQTFPDGKYYDEYRIGGTSLASPLFAGLTALAIEHARLGGRAAQPDGVRQRRSVPRRQGHPEAGGDVRVDFANGIDATSGLLYSVRTFNQDSSLKIGKGLGRRDRPRRGEPGLALRIGALTSARFSRRATAG